MMEHSKKKCQVQTSISYEIATLYALIRAGRIAIAHGTSEADRMGLLQYRAEA
jgi:hypothetical protein